MRAAEYRLPLVELVSVVVPTRNSSRTLRSCLKSLRRQSHRALEVIVVDNGSTDATIEHARELADAVLTAGPERSAQPGSTASGCGLRPVAG